MPNMSPKKNEMPTQDPKERSCNFKEVALGYSKETAIDYVKNVVAPKVETPVIDKPVEESDHSEQVEIEEASNVDDIKTEDDTPAETVETEAVSEEVSTIDDEPVEEDESSDTSTQHIEDNSSETCVRRNKKKKRH